MFDRNHHCWPHTHQCHHSLAHRRLSRSHRDCSHSKPHHGCGRLERSHRFGEGALDVCARTSICVQNKAVFTRTFVLAWTVNAKLSAASVSIITFVDVIAVKPIVVQAVPGLHEHLNVPHRLCRSVHSHHCLHRTRLCHHRFGYPH